MRRRPASAHLRLLRRLQKTDVRYAHYLHPEEGGMNLFFYNISQMTSEACQQLFANNTEVDFICILDEDLTIGLEIPYKQIDRFRQTNNQNENETANLLEKILNELIVKHYPTIHEKIAQHLTQLKKNISYSERDLKRLIFDFIVKPRKEDVSHPNTALLTLLQTDRKVRKIIKSHFQNGHPSIIPRAHKKAHIGGDLYYKDGVWIIRNKSGRYGQKLGNRRRALLFHAVHLMKIESILKSRGISAAAEIFFKPEQMPEYMHLLYELANEALENFRQTNQVFLSEASLNRIPNASDKYLFQVGMRHIQQHVNALYATTKQNDRQAILQHFPQDKTKTLHLYERYHQKSPVNPNTYRQPKTYYKHN